MTTPTLKTLFSAANSPTRRQFLRGVTAAAASSLLYGCASSNQSSSSTSPGPSTSTNPQPVPSGQITDASLTVTDTASGTIGSAFAGLSYEKVAVSGQNFTG